MDDEQKNKNVKKVKCDFCDEVQVIIPEDVQVGDEVAGQSEQNEPDERPDGVAERGRQDEREEQSHPDADAGDQENEDGAHDDAYGDDDHEQDEEHEVTPVADDQLEA